MSMKNTANLSTIRLFQLISSASPTGGFCYSQGVETAVHMGWIATADNMYDWLCVCLHNGFARLDLPVLQRCYQAVQLGNSTDFNSWNHTLYSHRETAELRAEEIQRGRALWQLLQQYELTDIDTFQPPHTPTQIAGLAYVGYRWGIDIQDLQAGYIYSWAENMVMAAIKLIPLGQSAGQNILFRLCAQIPETIETSYHINDADIGAFTPMVSIASSLHETQPVRLFRS